MSDRMDLGSVGVWSGTLRQDRPEVREAAAELEELGYGTIWFPGGEPAGLADAIQRLLESTRKAVVATGIVSVWIHPACDIAAMHHAVTQAHPARFLLGIGISHQPAVEAVGLTYARPLQKLASYLDELDSAPTPVPIQERILASVGPRSLALARHRSAGTHPFFVPVEHRRIARQAVGQGKIVAPELMVVLETDPGRARAIARVTTRLLNLPNYTHKLLRLGFSQSDFANDGSDRLVDAMVAWGDPEEIMQRVREHHAAGADHVCVQVLTDPPQDFAATMDGWRTLAREFSR
jgi:probable F420-dependent oxidoreductase